MCKYWKSPEELGGVVSRSLVQLMKHDPREGWVRARHASDAEEMLRLRKQIDVLKAKLEEARAKAPQASAEFSQGEETLAIRYSAKSSRPSKTGSQHVIVYSWNDLLGVLGPLMIDECNEPTLIRRLGDDIEARIGSKGDISERVYVNEDDLDAIIFQFLALKYITKSKKRHNIYDDKIYWALTPSGQDCLVNIKARKSEEEQRSRRKSGRKQPPS